MRLRIFLGLSLGVNVALAIWLVWGRKDGTGPAPATPPAARASAPAASVKTNTIIRRQFFSWQEVESTDYPTYIANLRSIGCPEQTIRDIIVADVNQLYMRKRATEIVTADQQWWRAEPDMDVTVAGLEKVQQLEAERKELLTSLLGAGWDSTVKTVPSPPNTPLDGPILGLLTPESRLAVKDAMARSEQKTQEYVEAQRKAGLPVSQSELAKMQLQVRNELAQILTPAQMEEYLLRYSRTAERLRASLTGVEVTPEEFKKLFQLRDAAQMQLDLAGEPTDAAGRKRAVEAAVKMEEDLKQVLGEERYQEHRAGTDPQYRSAMEVAESAGIRKELLQPLYEFIRAGDEEKLRIRSDPGLSAEQRATALAKTETEYLESLRKLLGDEGFSRYMQKRP